MGIAHLESAKSDKVSLESGDLVVFYTDGITEAHNEQFEQFSEERLYDAVKKQGDYKASDSAHNIVNQVNAFVGEAPQHDDITLLVIKIL